MTLTYLAEYISSLDADTFCNCGTGNRPDGTYIQNIDSFLYHDVTASYDFGDGTLFGENALNGLRLQAGITNISDEEPPFIEVGFNATSDPSTYRMMGRGYFLRMQYKFE